MDSPDQFPPAEDRDDATLREHGMAQKRLEVPAADAAMIVAHGINNANGKRVLYVALDANAIGVLGSKNPVLHAMPGVPGMEDWELIVIGPDGVGPFVAQVESANALNLAPEKPDNTDPMAGHGQ